MAFVPRLSTTDPTPMQGNPWWYSNGNIYYAYGHGLPNCTAYAYGRFAEIANQFIPELGGIGAHGDAKQWWNDTTALPKGSTPALGAVACWGSTDPNHGGHVAVVEQINAAGDIYTSNSAYNGTYWYPQWYYKSNGYYNGSWGGIYYFQGFIYNPYGGVGASDYVIAAMCGNFYGESNVNPGLWESLIPCAWDFQYDYTNRGGYGLGQWTNVGTPYGRCWNLHSWVTSNGYQDGDGNGQLAFLLHEAYWAGVAGPYRTLDEFLQSDSTNIPYLVELYMRNWEGIMDSSLPARQSFAQTAYDYIQAHKTDDPGLYTWISVNNYLTQSQMLNNVMCVYFWMIYNYGGNTARKRIPWWLLWKLSKEGRYFK